jgi:hypothetical protein
MAYNLTDFAVLPTDPARIEILTLRNQVAGLSDSESENSLIISDYIQKMPNISALTVIDFTDMTVLSSILRGMPNLLIYKSRGTTVPDLSTCVQLESVSITHCPGVTHIGSIKCNTASIRQLSLQRTRIRGILNLVRYPALRELDIMYTGVTGFEYLPAGVDTLYLDSTPFSDIASIQTCRKSLRILRLNECPEITDTHLHYICNNFYWLIDLSLAACNITALPAEIANLAMLEYLGLDDNPLSTLPDEIATMTHLTAFDIEGCPALGNLSPVLSRFIARFDDDHYSETAGDDEKYHSIFRNTENTHDTHIQAQMQTILNCLNSETRDASLADMITAVNRDIPCITRAQKAFSTVLHVKTNQTLAEIAARVWYLARQLPDADSTTEIQRNITTDVTNSLRIHVCFTGIVNQIITSLSGYYDFATFTISETQHLSNINSLIIEKLGADYNADTHRAELRERMTTDGYPGDVIDQWISYIE